MIFNSVGAMQPNVDAATAIPLPGIPAGAGTAWVQAEGGDIRWRDDGTDPTASAGFLLLDGSTLVYEGDPNELKVIAATSGAKINVGYYQ